MKDEQTRLAIEALKAAGCGVLAVHIESRIAELEKDAARLHSEIMNLPAKCAVLSHDETAYKEGHRDARHAAAEIVVAMMQKD